MTLLNTICQLVNLIAAGSALFLAGLFFLIVIRARVSSLAWINRLFIGFCLLLGGESLANVFDWGVPPSQSQMVMQLFVGLAMLICAVACVPLYKRIRRHPQYDELQAANKQLEYSKRLFKTFLDETPFAAYVVDADSNFLYANSKVRQDLNSQAQEIVGTSLNQWLPERAAEELVSQCQDVRSNGSRAESILVVPRGNNSCTYLSRLFPLPGPQAQPLVGVVSIEISEELQAKEMDALLASIVELSPSAIYTLSEAGVVTSWNRGAEQMLGYRESEIIGKSATLLYGRNRTAKIDGFIKRLESGEVIIDRGFIHVGKDGSRKLVTLSATKIKSFLGAGSSYAAIVHDETEARRAASEMKALNRELDMRIAQLSQANKELLRARDEALQASSLKSAFAANMSHALRTPLSGILGLSELILEKKLPPDIYDMVETINICADSLLKIVNDILDLSKLEDDRLAIENQLFSPAQLVEDCFKLLKPDASGKGLRYTLSIDPHLPAQAYGDASKVRQILLNLLGNAIKFTKTGSVKLETVLLCQSDEEATVQFSVTDSGMGIAPEDRHLLFQPFSRVEKSTRGVAGSGLGLAISKRFAQLMNGTIDFESVRGQGSKFICTIALQKVSVVAPAPVSFSGQPLETPADRLRNCRVLVVEDNRILSFLVMRQLANIGVIAESAMTAAEALTNLRATTFDIILLDINLPDMSGYDVAEKIRQTEAVSERNVIIAMTAGAMAGDRKLALAAGMNDYMAKPVNAAQLKEALARWMATKEDWHVPRLKTAGCEEVAAALGDVE